MAATNAPGVKFTETNNSHGLAYMAQLTIPIIILWMGIAMAVKGIEGSGMIMGRMQGAARVAGRYFSGANFVRDTYQAYRTRRNQAGEDSWARRLGTHIGSQQDMERGSLPGGRDAQLRYERDVTGRIANEGKVHDTANMTDTALEQLRGAGNAFESAAAIQELATRSLATQTDLDVMRRSFGETSQAFRQLQNKVKTYDPAAAFGHLGERAIKRVIKSAHQSPRC